MGAKEKAFCMGPEPRPPRYVYPGYMWCDESTGKPRYWVDPSMRIRMPCLYMLAREHEETHCRQNAGCCLAFARCLRMYEPSACWRLFVAWRRAVIPWQECAVYTYHTIPLMKSLKNCYCDLVASGAWSDLMDTWFKACADPRAKGPLEPCPFEPGGIIRPW